MRRLVPALVLGMVVGYVSPSPAQDPPPIQLERVVDGLRAPLHLTHAGDGSGRLFVVEQRGRIRIVKDGRLVAEPFLDLTGKVRSGGEMGLLSVAFYPDYAKNGRLFVNYTTGSPRRMSLKTVVSELAVSDDGDRVDVSRERVLFEVKQPFPNHNGGLVAFGPDGFLYIGMGDGGFRADPLNAGQNPKTLLGALLRIDIDAERKPYGIPADNPFADGKDGAPEVFAWGMRNPWRFCWDPKRPERLFVADVGQDKWEEIHLVAKGDNCGWNIMEGDHPFRPRGRSQEGLNAPIAEYPRREGKSITGGFVYRGKQCEALIGLYLFTDFYASEWWGLRETKGGGWERVSLGRHKFLVSSYGEDEAGEVYVLDYERGVVYRIGTGTVKQRRRTF